MESVIPIRRRRLGVISMRGQFGRTLSLDWTFSEKSPKKNKVENVTATAFTSPLSREKTRNISQKQKVGCPPYAAPGRGLIKNFLRCPMIAPVLAAACCSSVMTAASVGAPAAVPSATVPSRSR